MKPPRKKNQKTYKLEYHVLVSEARRAKEGAFMKVLFLVLEETPALKHFKRAFREKGLTAKVLDLKKVSLSSGKKGTRILDGSADFSKIDGVYLKAGLKLAQFAEPLLDELELRDIYVPVKRKSHYISTNEPLQLAMLSKLNVKIPRAITFGSPEGIKSQAGKFSYPVQFKAFRRGEKTMSMLVESERSLVSIADSLRAEQDAIIVREFIEGDIDESAIVGDKVFTIRREFEKDALQPMKKSHSVKLPEAEKEAAIHAAHICGYDIASVKMCKGYVLKVRPLMKINTFNRITGEDLYEEIADLYKQKLGERKKRRKKK